MPLRVVPALVYGSIVYGLVGLVPTLPGFWKFLLTLVLFNLTTASVVLFVSIAISNTAVAGLVGTLIMLYKYVVSLMNRPVSDKHQPPVCWTVDQSRHCFPIRRLVTYPLILPCRVRSHGGQRAPLPQFEGNQSKRCFIWVSLVLTAFDFSLVWNWMCQRRPSYRFSGSGRKLSGSLT